MRRLLLALSIATLGALASIGCSSGGSGGGPTPTPTVTVNGTVVAQGNSVEFALPLPGVVVLTSGHSPVVTGSGGRFTISGVKTPYDLTIIDSTNRKATVWRGLTRPDPTVSAATQLLA